MTQAYYLDDRRQTPVGAFSLEELRSLLLTGQVTPETYVAEDGGLAWQPLGSVLTPTTAAGESVRLPPAPPRTLAAKSKLAAGLLGIFLGALGIHNFYLGFHGRGIAQLLITPLSFGFLSFVSALWGLIEGILILVGSIDRDGRGVLLGE